MCVLCTGDEDEVDKQMGEVDGEERDKLDEQMWGSDEEEELSKVHNHSLAQRLYYTSLKSPQPLAQKEVLVSGHMTTKFECIMLLII